MAGTRLPPDWTGKGRTDNDMDQGMYKRPSNPLTEDDTRRAGNQTWGPYRHAFPPSDNRKSPTWSRDEISYLWHRAMEGGKSSSRNWNFLPEERLSPICHMRKPKMQQNKPHTHVNHNQQYHVGTNPLYPKHKALLRGRKLFQERSNELPEHSP